MPVDQELIIRKMRLILEDVARLEPLAQIDLEAYLADMTHELVAERLLERIIGRMIDINYHLAVETTGLPPRDYYASFLQLADLGVLPREEATVLAAAAGLRNRLAHEYNGIDERRVYAAVKAAVIDVMAYLRAVEAFISSVEGSGSSDA